jgi:hypothetical protein
MQRFIQDAYPGAHPRLAAAKYLFHKALTKLQAVPVGGPPSTTMSEAAYVHQRCPIAACRLLSMH